MKNASVYGKRLTSLLRQIMSRHRGQIEDPAEPITQMVVSFLEWNATRKLARAALNRVQVAIVDNNDLRVTHPGELEELLGVSYPMVRDRSERLHECLHEIYMREQSVSLDHLAKLPKREIREYLDTLSGITPFVAAQVTLCCFSGHAIPVDDQLADLLRSGEIVDPEATVPEIEAFLQHKIKADRALEIHASLMAWIDAGPSRVSAEAAVKSTRSKKKSAVGEKR